MNTERFQSLVERYPRLRLAVLGDFCLDRYLEIDPALCETSLETGRPVHNVVRVRSQPGGAGTILNNLAALGIGRLIPVGFAGEDGEGLELRRALERLPGVDLEHFITTSQRRTFTYCKPLIMHAERPPEELNRLDSKNWTPTPRDVVERLLAGMDALANEVDGFILLDQVDVPDTGVLSKPVLRHLGKVAGRHPNLLMVADSRRGLSGFPPVTCKMNRAELCRMAGREALRTDEELRGAARTVARASGRPVVVTLAEAGMMGVLPDGTTLAQAAFPVRGAIDIVGAGDSVTANLAAAWAAGADMNEALAMASAAASIVIHQLGTTGTASVEALRGLLVA